MSVPETPDAKANADLVRQLMEAAMEEQPRSVFERRVLIDRGR